MCMMIFMMMQMLYNIVVVEVVGECFKLSSDIGDDDLIVLMLILKILKNLMRTFMMILML